MSDHDDVARQVAGMFLGGGKKRPTRRLKPNRCLGCGKVTRHIFCPATYDACRALYRSKDHPSGTVQ